MFCTPPLLTSPPCHCNWEQLQAPGDNPAKERYESGAGSPLHGPYKIGAYSMYNHLYCETEVNRKAKEKNVQEQTVKERVCRHMLKSLTVISIDIYGKSFISAGRSPRAAGLGA